MRYTLHTATGKKIGEAETAQGIANIATHCTVSFDSNQNVAYPYTVYESENGHIVGRMYDSETEAGNKLRRLRGMQK